MSPADIDAYLHAHIPLSAAMGVGALVASDEEVVLEAPLAPNLNHRSTAFGGSLATLAVLSAWTWLHRFTRTRDLTPALVIQRENTQFTAPASDNFHAHCRAPKPQAADAFLKSLRRYRRARIELSSTLSSRDMVVGRFTGMFVALDAPPPDFGDSGDL